MSFDPWEVFLRDIDKRVAQCEEAGLLEAAQALRGVAVGITAVRKAEAAARLAETDRELAALGRADGRQT